MAVGDLVLTATFTVLLFFPPGSRNQRKYSFLTPNVYLYWLHYHLGTREHTWLLLHLPDFSACKPVLVLLFCPTFYTCYILPLHTLQIQSVGFRVSEPPLNCFPASFKEASNKAREKKKQYNGCKITSFQSICTHFPVFG